MSENQLISLRLKRGTVKGKVTRFHNFIQDVQKTYDSTPNYIIPNSKIRLIQLRTNDTERLLQEFEALQADIEFLDSDTTQALHDEERQAFEEKYYLSISLAQELLSLQMNEGSLHSSPPDNNDNLEPILRDNISCHSNSQHSLYSHDQFTQSNAIKLPDIKLPKFSGSMELWLEFRDTFKSLIHERNMSDIQKFHYLRASLEGRAEDVIHSIQLSAANYHIAWNLLCERYDNENLLTHNHVKSLFTITPLKRESSDDLNKLLDYVSKHLRSLNALNQPTNQWDTLIIYMVSEKLDSDTARHWEEFKQNSYKLSTFEDMKSFLRGRANILKTLEVQTRNSTTIKSSQTTQGKSNARGDYRQRHAASLTLTTITCPFCKQAHSIYNCSSFLNLCINERLKQVRELKLCVNCLRSGHSTKQCRSGSCRHCKGKHNTLLHFDRPAAILNSNTQHGAVAEVQTTCAINTLSHHVLLSTVLIQVLDVKGQAHTCRAILDSGSQSNFITSKFSNKLGLPKSDIMFSVIGIGKQLSNLNASCNVTIKSMHSAFVTELTCLVIDHILDSNPNNRFDISTLQIPSHIRLADPDFCNPKDIDILLGAGIFWQLLSIGQFSLGKGGPIAQKTKLGWIISGKIASLDSRTTHCSLFKNCCNLSRNCIIQQNLTKFWELEEITSPSLLSQEEQACETHFIETHKRSSSGRFIVSIPLKQSPSKLGDSYQTALKRFNSLERKLQSNSSFRHMYRNFMEEYEELGHMSKILPPQNTDCYYLPHHGVFKQDSATTKLRVVFDGSCPSDSGVSYNQLQMVGPTIQQELINILLRFRKHTFVVTADIAKMYRQILVAQEFRNLQLILWRPDPSCQLSVYSLNTVTYGTSSAPYLAIRCLKQLGINHESQFPHASQVIQNDFYVDDLVTGSDSLEALLVTCQQINTILQSGNFELRKWSSNSPQLISDLKQSISSSEILHFNPNEGTKTLGLLWSCGKDVFSYAISQTKFKSITKRTILSQISQIFDPLGLLSPCIIISKLILQQLWMLNLSWDEGVPADLHNKFINFSSELKSLESLAIPRHALCPNHTVVELHGFADASQLAYGACVYLRTFSPTNEIFINLLCAKGRVAPIKIISIPRLELCAALLLSKLVQRVHESMNMIFNDVTLWTDSTIVLSWIRTPPSNLQTFVANRVSQIQQAFDSSCWRHVPTKDNPADLISRGLSPRKLGESHIWWHGPTYLLADRQSWPVNPIDVCLDTIPELKMVKTLLAQNTVSSVIFPFDRFSSLNRLIRAVAYCFRFALNCKTQKSARSNKPLNTSELDHALNSLVRISQIQEFPEYKDIKLGRSLPSKSSLINLAPFMDSNDLLRVGGRLGSSDYTYQRKHPLLLPPKHELTLLIFRNEHQILLHAGPQHTLASIRTKFWPISGRSTSRRIVHECVRCCRFSSRQVTPIMGELPHSRVTSVPPFSITGVDYAGPFTFKDRKGRGCKVHKCYICLFICFATKAIHLELVTQLSMEAFLLTFRRFVSRRGKPSHMYSDNATNFVGASSELRELGCFLVANSSTIPQTISREGVQWHFIPPQSPHFGGLWEAGVKSTKHHLKRVMGNSIFTFEDFYTVLTQIECVLNSRPLSPMSCDPNDLEPLTPAHFLIGRQLTMLPDPNLQDISPSRLSHYQHIQLIQQSFWTRWSCEYVSELQHRTKWKQNQINISVGSMVVIKDKNLSPGKWLLGRVVEIHPGPDSITRVVSVKTVSGTVKRSVSRLCVLPVDPDSPERMK